MFITTEEIIEEFEDLDPRDQSQYLLELGYDLPRFSDAQRREEDLVHGCQSQVWMNAVVQDGDDPVIAYSADSDSEIVRGLITVLLAAHDGLTASQVLSVPLKDIFDRLHLKQYISPQRQNGLQGMVDRIRDIAVRHAAGTTSNSESSASISSLPTSATIVAEPETVATAAPLNADAVQQQFPVLTQVLAGGKRPVFLDSGASAQKPQVVIDKEREVEEQYFSNAYRGRYSFGARIDDELESSRHTIAQFLGAQTTQQVAFTPGTTATLNMIAFGWGGQNVQAGDEILITEMEHHANFVPWQQLAAQKNATLKFIPLTPDGRLDMNRLDEVLTRRTKIVAVAGMSNVLGTVNPIAELTRRTHEVGGVIVVDGAQSVPHMAVNVAANDVDFLVFSGHKTYGPTGVGVLYGRSDRLEEMLPTVFGGHMIDRVYKDHSTWAKAPAKFEAGTLPIVQAIALGTAINWIQDLGIGNIHDHEQRLLVSATEQLNQIPGMTIYGPDVAHKGAIVSFRVKNVHPEDLAAILDRHAVSTRHGHHCTMPLHDLLGVSATTRASFAAYNTDEDVAALVTGIRDAVNQLRR